MIYVTGDTHGDLNRFKHPMFRKIKKRDILIICGDFGFIWDGDANPKEKRVLKWLGKRRYEVLFVDGVHENFAELEKYEVENWNGGKTRKISGKLRQLIRGHVFDLGGKKVLAFGGGQYQAKQEDFDLASQSLSKHDYKIDYIVSHEPPTQLTELLTAKSGAENDNLSYFLDEISRKTDYKRWFFGRHHINKVVASKYFALFDNVISTEYDPATKK
ncbi:MAG: metallophosphoesterase [Oscillospiraceae bacterium]|nr:metallophosphoesterase [Oscillospiraceae bacterium]